LILTVTIDPTRPEGEEVKGIMFRVTIISMFAASVVVLGTAAQAPASAHTTHRAALVTKIKVIAKDIKFKLSAKTAKRGVVVFKVTNKGSLTHNFHIKGRTTRKLSHGQSATLRVTFLRKGRYPYKCTVDGHAEAGMKGVFRIT
jgi:uncharacterized cupredoxin-like copper-binding protein